MKKFSNVLRTALVSVVFGAIASETLFTSSLYAQTMNEMPLSQQTLLEMQSNNSPLNSGSMQLFKFGKNVTVTPIENIKAAINWISNIDQQINQQTDQVEPEEPFNQTIINFKRQQKQQLKRGRLISQ